MAPTNNRIASIKKKRFSARKWPFAIVLAVSLIAIGSIEISFTGCAAPDNRSMAEILASAGDFEEATVCGEDEEIIDIPCAGIPCLIDVEYDGIYYYGYEMGYCGIWITNKEGEKLDLLANGVGPFDGTYTDWGFYKEATALNINAEGSWSITFRPLSTMEFAENGDSFYGSNVVAIDTDEISEVSFTHDGSSNFIVGGIGIDNSGLLVNEVGLFKGTITWTEPEAFFIVQADGEWTISW